MKSKEDINFNVDFDPEKTGFNDSDDTSWLDAYAEKPRKPKKKDKDKKPSHTENIGRPEKRENEPYGQSKPKKPKEKKKKADTVDQREYSEFVKFFLDRRTHAVAGIALILFAAYMIVSAMSYFSSAADDQSVVENMSIGDAVTTGQVIYNAGGPVGASMSHFLLAKGWGVGAFAIIFYIIVLGLSLVGYRKRLHFWKFTLKCLITTIGISVVVDFAEIYMHLDRAFPFGGYHGLYVNLWLISRIGVVGALAVSCLMLAIMFYMYARDISGYVRRLMAKRRMRREYFSPEESEEPISDKNTGNDTPVEQVETEPEIMTVNATFDNVTQEEYDSIKSDAQVNTHETAKNPEETAEPDFEVKTGEIEAAKEGDTSLYDPTAELSHYRRPGLNLLIDRGTKATSTDREEQEENKERITKTLLDYGIPIAQIKATVGPTVTLYEIIPAEGVRIAKIKRLEDDIALSLAALGIRIIAPIPGKGTIGIEVPNKDPQTVSIRSVLGSKAFQECKYQLPMAMGSTISNEVYIADLAKMPHLLVAGATGQGKSVGLNTIIASLLYKKHPAELKFVLVDPKMVEFSLYSKLQYHFMAQLSDDDDAVVTDMDKVERTLNSLCVEMDNRYDLLRDANVRSLSEYNEKFVNRRLNPEKGHRFLPYIVIIVDEFADLIMTSGKAIETPIARIAQKARAVGMHMIIATQRPSTNVITGIIKANFPGRVAFRVSQMVDSKTILDRPGANQLIGRGDMLFSHNGAMERVQCAFIDTPEVEAMVESIATQPGYEHPYFLPEPKMSDAEISVGNITDRDPLFEDAARYLCSTGDTASTSSLQRRFSIGYNRAGKIMDQLEAAGVVGPAQGSKPRALLIDLMQLDMMIGQ